MATLLPQDAHLRSPVVPGRLPAGVPPRAELSGALDDVVVEGEGGAGGDEGVAGGRRQAGRGQHQQGGEQQGHPHGRRGGGGGGGGGGHAVDEWTSFCTFFSSYQSPVWIDCCCCCC